MKKRTMSLLTLAILNFAYGQKDSLNQKNIEEVVITGQYTPQSIKKSLYKVEVISNDDIKRMAVNNVAEVLNQTLNILIIPEKNTGDSKASILGLGADYTKVLVDNIPVVGDTGLGSNIDLTKLSLDNIERIEIVKGSMGVEFGNNAVAGVINIITKKNSNKKWNIRGFIQEETVGKEYDWVDYGKGRHIQSLGISHNISDKWFADVSINRNDFQGFWGNNQGKNYFLQDSRRGYEWQPKEQWNPTFMLRFSAPKTQFFYKADYLMEEINFYNPLLVPKDLGAGERTFTALDRDYFTQRMLHHFNIQTELFKKTKFTGDFSYQKQSRKKEDYLFDVPAIQELSRENKTTYYQAETFYSRGTISNFLNSNKSNLQLGYEGDYTKGFAGMDAGKFDNNNVVNDVLNLSVFASAEFDLNSNWFLRPGVRMNFSDTFETKPNFSLVLKKAINDQSEFRAIVGSANKNPTFEELFTYMVDSNHNIQGSSDLKPENSYSGMLYYSLFSKSNSPIKWSLDVSSLYLQTQDRIELAITSETPLQYKYINVDSYESWLNTISGKISNKNFGVNLGFSVLGRMLDLNQAQDNSYQYSPEVNASAYYNLLKTKTSLAVYYKGVGRTYRIMEDKSLGVTQYILGRQNAFSLMDASISQKIWKDHFTLTLGVRNIFDISDVRNGASGGTGGAHATTGAAERMFYGRSYFARFNFNF
ncbi:MAG: TonB-dependent receptor plug domain-containing protein [Chryseobacterium sp.]|nr:TonB-dependent receptor plug domain-containing protein [Chryseobacterium sp.]MBP7500411.1 TonB-dependent receptor plug domain-containing protein [Chryseobacterium sp.]